MSLLRILNKGFSRLNLSSNVPVPLASNFLLNNVRHFRRGFGRTLRVMMLRRKIIGPERVRRRSEWDNWNYKAELYAFAKRLNENISEETLRWAFIHDSYIEKESLKRKELDMPSQDVQLDLKSNATLITTGEEIVNKFLRRYLTFGYPKLPEEGIQALQNHLTSDDLLSYVSFNLGTSDLIYCAEHPPEKETLAQILKALIAGISMDDSLARAENFVLDFICPELIGKDVFEIWDLENPMEVLSSILKKHGHAECEPRLIFESGRNSMESIYNVGLYSNKVFLGRGPGETLDVAVEMAAYDVLRKCFRLRENETPLNFGERLKSLNLLTENNPFAVSEWYCKDLEKDLTGYLFSLTK